MSFDQGPDLVTCHCVLGELAFESHQPTLIVIPNRPQACEARRGRERNLLCGGRSDTTSMFLASKSRVLYVDVTGFLMARVLQHKTGEGEGLTPRYKVNRMVHFEVFQYVNNDRTETEIKKWRRERRSHGSRRTIRVGKILLRTGGESALMARADSSPAEAGSE